MDYMREEMQRTLKGLVGPSVIFLGQLFIAQRAHVFLPNFVSFLMVTGAQIFTACALKRTSGGGYAQTKRVHFVNSIVHHTVRTFAHVVYIAYDHTDMFGRLFFLFVAPCSAARISSYTTFVGFLVVHLVLLFYRFASDFSDESPFLITAVACVHILYETSLLKKRGEEAAIEKSSAWVTMTEGVAEEVFECFCDATARISPGLDVVQESPSLATLLGRSVYEGRSFTDFIHIGDRDNYIDFLQQNFDSALSDEDNLEGSGAQESDHVKGLRLWSIDLYLEDSMNIPLDVHVFHARLKNLEEQPVYLIGISERESYKHAVNRKKKAAVAGKRRDRTCLDFESGKLSPAWPAFDQKDMALMSDLGDLRRYSEAESSGSGMRRSGKLGNGSPPVCPRKELLWPHSKSPHTKLDRRISHVPDAD